MLGHAWIFGGFFVTPQQLTKKFRRWGTYPIMMIWRLGNKELWVGEFVKSQSFFFSHHMFIILLANCTSWWNSLLKAVACVGFISKTLSIWWILSLRHPFLTLSRCDQSSGRTFKDVKHSNPWDMMLLLWREAAPPQHIPSILFEKGTLCELFGCTCPEVKGTSPLKSYLLVN